MPVVVHQLPDFDQDSWTVSQFPGNEKNATGSSLTALPSDRTNNNNNNSNAIFIDSQGPRYCSEVTSQPPANQTLGNASTSAPVANGACSVTTSSASLPSQPNSTSSESHTAAAPPVDAVSTNGAAAELQATDETSEQPVINGEDVQEASSGGQDGTSADVD